VPNHTRNTTPKVFIFAANSGVAHLVAREIGIPAGAFWVLDHPRQLDGVSRGRLVIEEEGAVDRRDYADMHDEMQVHECQIARVSLDKLMGVVRR
jgi:hypothetical protein